MLPESIHHIFETVANPDSTSEQVALALNDAIVAFYAAESPDEIEAGQHKLALLLDGPTDENSKFAVVLNGFLVEAGFPTGPLLAAYEQRLAEWINGARRFESLLPEPDEETDNEERNRQFARIAQENPQDFDLWTRLEAFYLPLIAALSADKNARIAFQHHLERIQVLEERMESAKYITLLLGVLNDEPLLVLEPSTGKGFEGQMNGIADNFQLHMMLQKTFQELDGRPRIEPEVAATVSGEGEQVLDVTVHGSWDMRNYTVLRPDGSLPSDYESGVIWNEGRPTDIEVFEGRRVIILAPPSYQRTWQAQRLFSKLKANIEVAKVLSVEEVRGWVAKLTTRN
jgi:hypothetical protein